MIQRPLSPAEKAVIGTALRAVLPDPERTRFRFSELRLPAGGEGVTTYCGTYAIFHRTDAQFTGGPFRLVLELKGGAVQSVKETFTVPPSVLEKGEVASMPSIMSMVSACSRSGYGVIKDRHLPLEIGEA